MKWSVITEPYPDIDRYFKNTKCNSRYSVWFSHPSGRAECTHLLRYQSIEVNHYICSSDVLNMGTLNSWNIRAIGGIVQRWQLNMISVKQGCAEKRYSFYCFSSRPSCSSWSLAFPVFNPTRSQPSQGQSTPTPHDRSNLFVKLYKSLAPGRAAGGSFF